MKIFILGGTGFIGQHLCRGFLKKGHEVTLLIRSNKSLLRVPPGATAVLGDPLKGGDWQNIAREADIIINLVGETIFHRWT
jgi:nucleoside-diphosphate-sugar epimerase